MPETEDDLDNVPLFDGSEDEPEGAAPSMDLLDLFFDMDGSSISPDVFKARYPDGRSLVAGDRAVGLDVVTEFVGINHNSDPDGQPWIYETLVKYDGSIVFSHWTTSASAAALAHTAAIWRVWFGGSVLWRVAVVVGRVRAHYDREDGFAELQRKARETDRRLS
jgi:hypothetical protein